MCLLTFSARTALALTTLIGIAFLITAGILHQKFPSIERQGYYLVLKQLEAKKALKERWYIVGDDSVLREDYGKEIRQLAARLDGIEIWVPETERVNTLPSMRFDRILIFGKAAHSLAFNSEYRCGEILYFNPFFKDPPNELRVPTHIYTGNFRHLPQIEHWRSLAEQEDYLKLHMIRGYADHIEGVWMRTVLEHFEQGMDKKEIPKPRL